LSGSPVARAGLRLPARQPRRQGPGHGPRQSLEPPQALRRALRRAGGRGAAVRRGDAPAARDLAARGGAAVAMTALLGGLVAALALGASPAPGGDFTCTEVLGVSVTGDWFGAGFEDGIDGGRWQARSRTHAFVEQWADPNSDLWSLP